jgi:hypothetical protein
MRTKMWKSNTVMPKLSHSCLRGAYHSVCAATEFDLTVHRILLSLSLMLVLLGNAWAAKSSTEVFRAAATSVVVIESRVDTKKLTKYNHISS